MAASCEKPFSWRDRWTASRRVETQPVETGEAGVCVAGIVGLSSGSGPKESLPAGPTSWRTKIDWAIWGLLGSVHKGDPWLLSLLPSIPG